MELIYIISIRIVYFLFFLSLKKIVAHTETYIHKCSGERLEILNRYWQPGFNNDGLILGVGADNSVSRVSDWKARCNTDMGSSPRCSKGFLSRVSFRCRFSYGVRTAPCVQSHASTYVRTFKIPNTGRHTIVWTHGNTTYTNSNG